MKTSLILISLLYTSCVSAQIIRPDGPSSGGTPTHGSNYGDHQTIGQPNPPTPTAPAPAPPIHSSGCNFSCKNAPASSETTPAGIALNTDWKKKLNAYALQNVVHPAWGYTHSERDYQNTKSIVQAEGIAVDEDVLFAAAFLHDLGGLDGFSVAGVDHGVRSAELAGPLLKSFGFPEEKIDQVKEVIIGHVYNQPEPKSALARAFRDADMVDFLGALGIARLLSASNELGSPASIAASLGAAKSLRDQLPAQFNFEISKKMAQKRIKEGNRLLKQLKNESLSGLAF